MGGESDGTGTADLEATAPTLALSPEVNNAIPRPKNMKPTRGSAITSKRLVRRPMEAVDFLVLTRYREDTLKSIPTGSTSRYVDSIDDDSTADSDKPLLDSQGPDDVPDYTRYIRAQSLYCSQSLPRRKHLAKLDVHGLEMALLGNKLARVILREP